MTSSQGAWVLVFLLALIGLVGYSIFLPDPQPEPAGVTNWEYCIESPSDFLLTATLNSLGADGWEMVSARRAVDSETNIASYEMIFKRPTH